MSAKSAEILAATAEPGHAASDEVPFADLQTLGKLSNIARAPDVRERIEGPGPLPMQRVKKNPARVANFCSMKIMRDVRDYAAKKGISSMGDAIQQGLEEKAREFKERGAGVVSKA